MSSSPPSAFAMPILRFQSVKTTVQKHIQFAQPHDASPQTQQHQQHHQQQAMAMHGVGSANFLHTFLHSWMCLGAILSILGLIVWTLFKFCSNSESDLPWQDEAPKYLSEKEDYEESLQRTRQWLREMHDDGIDTDIF